MKTNEAPEIERQLYALRLALSELPYGGLAMHAMPHAGQTPEQQIERSVATLKIVASELRKMSEQRDRERDELRALQLQQQQTRRFLGLDQLQSSIEQLQLDVAARVES